MSLIIQDYIPSFVKEAYAQVNKTTYDAEFYTLATRVAIAAGICLSVYNGHMLGAALCATLSLPATVVGAGALLLTYGLSAVRAGIAAKQLFQIAMGAALIYNGWQMLDKYKNFQGLIETPRNGGAIINQVAQYFVSKQG